MPRSIETIAAEANRLYWDTETSVSDIAAQLELSRRALYTALEPLPTDRSCGLCGSPLVYENRSARGSGTATCPNGDAVDEIPDEGATYATAPASERELSRSRGGAESTGARGSRAHSRGTAWTWSRGSLEAAGVTAGTGAQRAAVIGAAVAGAAVGALVTLLLVPRR